MLETNENKSPLSSCSNRGRAGQITPNKLGRFSNSPSPNLDNISADAR